MKKAKTAIATGALASIVLLLILAGCGGGESSHDIVSPSSGTSVGMKTVPEDSDTDVPSDAWIRVYWPFRDLRPPADFTVRVQRADDSGDWHAVYTDLREGDSDPDAGSWWFEPSASLDSATWYRILVTDSYGNREVSVFRTRGTAYSASASESAYRPAGAKGSTGTVDSRLEHRIVR